jgi:hypothetical protein
MMMTIISKNSSQIKLMEAKAIQIVFLAIHRGCGVDIKGKFSRRTLFQ